MSEINFYHGGVEQDFDESQIDILRKSFKQQNSHNSYVGFYMFDEENFDMAVRYANQENALKQTNTKGVLKVVMSEDVNICWLTPFTITRVTEEQIINAKVQGYDLIAGTMLNSVEYVLVNKDKIIKTEFIPLDKVEDYKISGKLSL